MTKTELLPNLGAEEGDDWHAFRTEARVRMAARLWSLLYPGDARLSVAGTSTDETWTRQSCAALWPAALGPVPTNAVFDGLAPSSGPIAWLNTESLDREAAAHFDAGLSGPSASIVSMIHDKAFSVSAANDLGLLSSALEPTLRIVDPDDLRTPDSLIESLDTAIREWPTWTHGKFTLKPRRGSSGRGRVAGSHTLDHEAIRGAFPRLAKRGGAIFEPWLERQADLSVALLVPDPEHAESSPTILGSLEMLVTAGGVPRGHCGEVDSRGRVFSGHREDETLRADAASVANHARKAGFFGPCGVDALTYLESDRERLRSVVEFNARMTMGLVAIGLVRRALPRVREALELSPGARRGFILTFVAPGAEVDLDALIRAGGADTIAIDLTSPGFEAETRPLLIFARERDRLRQAHREIFGC